MTMLKMYHSNVDHVSRCPISVTVNYKPTINDYPRTEIANAPGQSSLLPYHKLRHAAPSPAWSVSP